MPMKKFMAACLLPITLFCVIESLAQNGASLQPTYLKGKWGFADSKGTLVIPAKFDAALPFKDALAKVGLVDEELPEIDSKPNIKWGYIDEKGNVINGTVVKSTHKDFEEPALEAVKGWKFRPAKKEGVAVKVRVTAPLRFKVED